MDYLSRLLCSVGLHKWDYPEKLFANFYEHKICARCNKSKKIVYANHTNGEESKKKLNKRIW